MNEPPTAVQTVVLTQLMEFNGTVFVPSDAQLLPPSIVFSTDPSFAAT